MVKNLVLVGMMGSGKSTVGYLLAQVCKGKFVDTDAEIEKRENMSIEEIFKDRGQEYFRAQEKKVIEDTCRDQGQVIATGGGVVLDGENIKKLKANGLVIFLNGDGELLFNRLNEGKTDRPLLNVTDLRKRIEGLLEERRTCYNMAADYTVELEGKTPQVLVREIMDIYCNKA